jgi:hypothetical protein
VLRVLSRHGGRNCDLLSVVRVVSSLLTPLLATNTFARVLRVAATGVTPHGCSAYPNVRGTGVRQFIRSARRHWVGGEAVRRRALGCRGTCDDGDDSIRSVGGGGGRAA